MLSAFSGDGHVPSKEHVAGDGDSLGKIEADSDGERLSFKIAIDVGNRMRVQTED